MEWAQRILAATLIIGLTSVASANDVKIPNSPSKCQRLLTFSKSLLVSPAADYVSETQHLGFTTPLDDYYRPDQVRRDSSANSPLKSGAFAAWLRMKEGYQFFGRRVLGFIRGSRGHWRDCIYGDPDYALTIGRGLQTCFVDLPVQSVMWVTTDRLYKAGFLTSLAAWMYYSYTFTDKIVHPLVISYAQNVEDQQVVEHGGFYLKRLQYDMYHRPLLRRLWQEWPQDTFGQFQKKREVLERIRERQDSIRDFISTFDYKKTTYTEEEVSLLIQQDQFRHLSVLNRKYGLLGRNPAISGETWRDIFVANWLMHGLVWHASDLLLRPGYVLDRLSPDSPLFDEVKAFVQSDYYVSVQKHRTAGELTVDEAAALIGDFFFYRVHVLEMEWLGLPSSGESWSDIEKQIIQRGLVQKNQWRLPENFEKLDLTRAPKEKVR